MILECQTVIPPTRKTKSPQALQMPEKLTELLPLIRAFSLKKRSFQIESDHWFLLCHQGGGFNRWQNQQFYPTRFSAVEFAALAARAYQGLAELDLSQIPRFAPLSVTDVVKWARQGFVLIPQNIQLPGSANHPAFLQGLLDLQGWKPSDLPKGTTGHGDPVRRWFFSKVIEEFFYSFAQSPSFGAIKDIVRLVWVSVDDKTIRFYVTDQNTLSIAEKQAQARREFDNKSKTITNVVINRATVKARTPKPTAVSPKNDADIIKNAIELLGSLSDLNARSRALSLLRALQDEMGFITEESEDDWQ